MFVEEHIKMGLKEKSAEIFTVLVMAALLLSSAYEVSPALNKGEKKCSDCHVSYAEEGKPVTPDRIFPDRTWEAGNMKAADILRVIIKK